MEILQLVGLDDSLLLELPAPNLGHRILKNTLLCWNKLRQEGEKQGLDLRICSSWRSFSRQVEIWNKKVRGDLPLLDRNSKEHDPATLSSSQKIEGILTWSALPGASRHHWGSDLDVWDTAAMTKEDLQLVPEEYATGGPMEKLGIWLNTNLADSGFFRPYDRDRGGVSPEPWHLSCVDDSRPREKRLTPKILRPILKESDILLKKEVLEMLPEIFERWVWNVGDNSQRWEL